MKRDDDEDYDDYDDVVGVHSCRSLQGRQSMPIAELPTRIHYACSYDRYIVTRRSNAAVNEQNLSSIRDTDFILGTHTQVTAEQLST